MEDKIASKANLVRRGICTTNNICCMCGEEEKNMSHLFCTCRFACLVQFKCYDWTELASTGHWQPKKHFVSFKVSGVNNSVNQIWSCVDISCRRIMETKE